VQDREEGLREEGAVGFKQGGDVPRSRVSADRRIAGDALPDQGGHQPEPEDGAARAGGGEGAALVDGALGGVDVAEDGVGVGVNGGAVEGGDAFFRGHALTGSAGRRV